MAISRRKVGFRWWYKRNLWFWLLVLGVVWTFRLTKGALLTDAFSFFSRPFWPGTAQKEWIEDGVNLEQQIRLTLLEKDNQRLRNLLDLKTSSEKNHISASVISRKPNGFWQQLYINKGLNDGVKNGDPVIGPGGLLGIVQSVTPTTARVRLLTAPGSKIGVWIERTKVHGILIGTGNNRPQFNFFERTPEFQVGDVVSTSPASTLLPPNLTIGVVQQKNDENLPAPFGLVQLLASPEAIDWVQVVNW